MAGVREYNRIRESLLRLGAHGTAYRRLQPQNGLPAHLGDRQVQLPLSVLHAREHRVQGQEPHPDLGGDAHLRRGLPAARCHEGPRYRRRAAGAQGVVKFVGWLKALGFEDVTMTTNGFLLEENLDGLVEAGLDRINISLDTLQPEKFAFITRRNHFEKVWNAIMAALKTPLSPVKINAVAMRGVNDDEISEMAKLTLEYPMHVLFIELMPLNGDTDGSLFRSLFVSGKELLERAQEELGELTEIEPDDPAG